MSTEIFAFLLLLVSTLTGLATQALKTVLTEHDISYKANTLAGIVAVVLSAAVGLGYMSVTGITVRMVLCVIALVFLSWLCAMVGYDKVKQTLAQLTGE